MIRIINHSNYPTTSWVDFAPKKNTKYSSLQDPISGDNFPVVTGKDGFCSTKVTLPPKTSLWLNEGNDDVIATKFQLSDWVSDNILDLIPEIHIDYNSTIAIINNLVVTKEVEVNDAVAIYELEGFRQGWKVRLSVSIYSEQDVAEIQMQIKWSNPQDTSWFVNLKSVKLYANEEYHIDYATKLGVTYSREFNRYVTTLFSSSGFQLGDGQPLNYRGAIFCRPNWMRDPVIRLKLTPEQEFKFLMDNQDRFTNFESRKQFPIVAMDDHREFFGAGATKILTWPEDPQLEINARVATFESQMHIPGSHFDLRLYSNSPNTGATGDQIVFGSVKDAATILSQDGRFLYVLGYHHTYPMRPFHWHDASGKDLQAKDHPNCTTWNLIPDYRLGSDMLGKPRTWAPSNFAGGYNGPDEEHHQQLYETFAANMRREPILRWSFESLVQASLMMKKNRMGAPRAVGRQLDTWMELLPLIPRRDAEIGSLINDKVSATKASWTGKFVSGPVKPLNTVAANGRGLVNYDYWVPWEQSLFSIGAYKYLVNNTDPEFRQIVLDVTRSVVEYGFIPLNGGYSVATCVRWHTDGTPVVITDEGAQIGTRNDKEIRLDSNFVRWTMPALIVHILLAGPSATKASQILAWYGRIVTKSRDSEWLSLGRLLGMA